MSDNKKIKNANPKIYNGIKFRSLLEVTIYKTLLEEGFSPEYEKHTYVLWEGGTPTIPFLTLNTLKRKDKRCVPIGLSTMSVWKPLSKITYTPDFYFEYNGKKVIVEAKGIPNEVYPYKIKMFRKYLEGMLDKNAYIIWEIHTKKQLLECIELLKNQNNC